MSRSKSVGAPEAAGRGMIAGLLGAAAMTAFQLVVEMPLTGRKESYAPVALLEKLLPIRPEGAARRRLNYATHFGVGASWGAGHALIARRAGLHGQRAVGAAFAALWGGDVIANTALGLTRPWEWSGEDLLVDVADKLVLAEATGLIYDRLAASS